MLDPWSHFGKIAEAGPRPNQDRILGTIPPDHSQVSPQLVHPAALAGVANPKASTATSATAAPVRISLFKNINPSSIAVARARAGIGPGVHGSERRCLVWPHFVVWESISSLKGRVQWAQMYERSLSIRNDLTGRQHEEDGSAFFGASLNH
jgi:hypothetical protein